GVLRAADHDLAADRQLLERQPRAGERGILRGLHVGASEPARSAEGGALGDPGEALARAVPAKDRVGHAGTTWAESTTRPTTSSIERSTFAFSTTETPSRRARDTM